MKKQIHPIALESGADDCLQAAICLLEQGMALLALVSDDAYGRRMAVAANASIGGHYRHCLDHFDCLLESIGAGAIDYDRRKRDLNVESKRERAIEVTQRISESLRRVTAEQIQSPVTVLCKVHYQGDRTQEVASTLAREIMYVVAHGVHHFALIAVMARVMDFPLPSNFGVAPSTLQHRASLAARVSEVA